MHKEHKVQVARVRAVHEKSMQSKEGSTYSDAPFLSAQTASYLIEV